MTTSKIAIGLDVGERRIGVARADLNVGLASALSTLERSNNTIADLQKLFDDNNASLIVVGIPRGMDGQETAQTKSVRDFTDQLKSHIQTEVIFQDETLTSHQAEAELEKRGKPYKKSDIDALAAIYILEDYMSAHRQLK